ncbi:39S ribosomal protein L39, mitochondrial-like [Centruroides sculpturatus]|uniref:39S ribosomal protein L39, mitochondrial-like n=1 Tax=Centruroides sculpturatus TaxID=218467 RepID=UPI000C6EA3E6|nr:39S ribosomal protein L39, mitochondrial-like [Centruroides sculpturatus]
MMRFYVREATCCLYRRKNILDGIRQKYLCTLTNEEVREKRNKIFEKEKARQRALITRVEKIEVNYVGVPEECTLLMNKNISTPYDCTMHVSEMLRIRSIIPLVNNELWDMHRPLEDDCTLDFLHFKIEDPHEVNKAFWRSCSFMLGMIIERAFKDNVYVQLHSWPRPDGKEYQVTFISLFEN